MGELIDIALGGASKFLGGIWGYIIPAALAFGVGGWCMYVFMDARVANLNTTIANMHTAQADAVTQAVKDASTLQASIDGINLTFAVATVKADALIEQQTVFIEKEIPRYVTREVDHKYPIPNSLVWVHDAAIRGVDPATVAAEAGGAGDAPSSITASAFATNDNENYGVCRQAIARVGLLNAYSDKLIAAWNEYAKKVSANGK